jgi:hypothetical protein
VIANPSLLDDIPDSAGVVVMPVDDPELAQQNLMLALQMAEHGETVVLQRVGIPPSRIPTWATAEQRSFVLQPIAPTWPAQPPNSSQRNWAIMYDHGRDELVVDLYDRGRPSIGIPKNDLIGVWMEQETQEIVGYVMYHFLESIAPRAPRLIGFLRNATLIGIDETEIGQLGVARDASFGSWATAQSLIEELGRLSA